MSPNPEHHLTLELQDVVQGRPPRSQFYLNQPDLVGSLGGQGSQNWPVMGAAVSYCLDLPGLREKWLAFFAKSMEGLFMGTECWSSTYGLWGHALPVAAVHTHAVAEGQADVAAGALGWLRVFWGVYRECTAPDGTILTVGLRSSPWHDPVQCSTWLAWVRAMALGEDQSRWQALGRTVGLGMRQSFITPTATAVKASLAAAMSLGSPPEPFPAFACLTPMHVLRGDGFLAVWLDQNVNSNTPPLAAAAWVNGTVTYLPGPFSQVKKIRGQLDKITVTQSAAGLDYTSSLYPAGQISLPAGGVETVYGDGNADTGSIPVTPVTPVTPITPVTPVTPITPVTPPVVSEPVIAPPIVPVVPPVIAPIAPIAPIVPADPIVPPVIDPIVPPPEPITPVPPVIPPVDLGRVADLIAGLLLPHRQADEQRSLVAELRAGTTRPLNEIADEVAAFGVGLGQPQAVPWQEAIRMLRGGSAPDTAPSGSPAA